MLSKDALEHIEKNAIAGSHVDGTKHAAVVLPEGYELHSLQEFNECRDHYKAIFSTGVMSDFATYVNGQTAPEKRVFVDMKSMHAGIIFDLGSPEMPGHGFHKASLQLAKTPEMGILEGLGDRMTQRGLAEFMEDFAPLIRCLDENQDEIPVKKAIATVRRLTVERLEKRSSDVETHRESRSALEEIELKGDVVPAYMIFRSQLYYELSEHEISYRLTSRLDAHKDGRVEFRLRPVNWEKVMESLAMEFKHTIQQAVVGLVLIGKFDAR